MAGVALVVFHIHVSLTLDQELASLHVTFHRRPKQCSLSSEKCHKRRQDLQRSKQNRNPAFVRRTFCLSHSRQLDSRPGACKPPCDLSKKTNTVQYVH